MRRLFLWALLLTFSATCHAFYDGDDAKDVKVIKKASDFDKILQSDAIWMVQFFEPSSYESRSFVGQYKQVAYLLKGIIHIAAVDITSSVGEQLASAYQVKEFPTFYIFGHDKKSPKVYDRPREVQILVQTLMDTIINVLGEREKKSGTTTKQETKSSSGPSKVVPLTSANFQELVLQNPLVSMVAFVAPWCGHCQKLLLEWEEASRKLDGEGAFLGLVDATVEKEIAAVYGVRSYPTIKVFPGGSSKSHSDAKDYEGQRTMEAIVAHALGEVDRTGVPKEIPELTNLSVLNETCQGHNRICVIAALPHIMDTGADGRNKYRNILAAVAKKFRGSAFHFLWFEGTSQSEFEQALELTFGFPSLVALSLDRQAYAVQRGSFSEKAIGSFLRSVTSGRQTTIKLPHMPEIVTVEPWDGQDAPSLEEEIPLSEIMGWDDDEGEL